MPWKRGQSAIEFITTYSWSLLIIIVFLVVISLFIFSQSSTTYTPSSCYITSTLPCSALLFASNSVGSVVILSFTNNLGTTMYFPSNTFTPAVSTSTNNKFVGSCYPANAPSGSQVVCTATETGYSVSTGSEVNFPFGIRYELCSPTCSSAVYNTTGTGTAYSSQVQSVLVPVTVITSTATGSVAVDGVDYPNGATLELASGVRYSLGAGPALGYTFNSWVPSGNVVLGSNSVASTTISATSTGTVTLEYRVQTTFYVPTPTASPSSVSQGSTSTISDSGAEGGTTPYTYQWIATIPGNSVFTSSNGNTLCGSTAHGSITCTFATNTMTTTGTYQFELQATDSGSNAVTLDSAPVTVTVSTPPATVTLSFSNGNSISQYTSDVANGFTSIAGHTVEIEYCYGSTTCTPSTIFATGTTSATNNLDNLGAGNYVFEAYDVNSNVYSATNVVSITPSSECENILYSSLNGIVLNTVTISYTLYGGGGGGSEGQNYGNGTSAVAATGSFTISSGNVISVFVGGGGGGGGYGESGGGGGGGSGYYGGGGGTSGGSGCDSSGGGGAGSTAILSNNVLISGAISDGGNGGDYSANCAGAEGGSTSGGTCGESSECSGNGGYDGGYLSGGSGGDPSSEGGAGGSQASGGAGYATGGGGGGYGGGGGGGAAADDDGGAGGSSGGTGSSGTDGAGGGPGSSLSRAGVGGAGVSGYGEAAGGSGGAAELSWSRVGSSCNLIGLPLQVYSPTPATNAIYQTQNAYITDAGAYSGTSPYTYQWLAEAPSQSSFTASEANTLLGTGTSNGMAQSNNAIFVTSTSTVIGSYLFKLQATDSESPAATANSATSTITVTSPITLTFSNGNSIPEGTSDNAIGTTAITGDTVEIESCNGLSCTPTNILATEPNTASYNIDGLSPGNYVFSAYDANAGIYSTNTQVVVTAASVTLTFTNGNSITLGSADNAIGTTSKTGDTVEIESCNGLSCGTPNNVLATGTTTATYNINGLAVGNYIFDACDTTASVCSATNVVVVGMAIVTLSFSNSNSIPLGTSDTLNGLTSGSGDTIKIESCNGLSCGTPNNVLATGTTTATFNLDNLAVGNYIFDACDTTASICSATNAVNVYTQTFTYGGANECESCDSVTANSGYSLYLCAEGNWEPNSEESPSFTIDEAYADDYSAVGHQSSSTCTVPDSSTESMGILGVEGYTSYAVVNTLEEDASSATIGYSTNGANTIFISGACADYACTSMSIPSGCSQPVAEGTSGSYGSAYVDVCPSQSSGSYSVTLTCTSGDDCYDAFAVYTFLTGPPPTTVSLTFSNGNYIGQGTSDIANGLTSASGDTIKIESCNGLSCGTPNNVLATGTTTATYNINGLAVGNYIFDACDTTASVCSPTNVVVVVPAIVTLTFSNGNAISPHTSDTVNGLTSKTGDTVKIESCNGINCGTPNNVLATGTTTATYNINGLAVGNYIFDACDTTASVCSTTNVVVISNSVSCSNTINTFYNGLVTNQVTITYNVIGGGGGGGGGSGGTSGSPGSVVIGSFVIIGGNTLTVYAGGGGGGGGGPSCGSGGGGGGAGWYGGGAGGDDNGDCGGGGGGGSTAILSNNALVNYASGGTGGQSSGGNSGGGGGSTTGGGYGGGDGALPSGLGVGGSDEWGSPYAYGGNTLNGGAGSTQSSGGGGGGGGGYGSGGGGGGSETGTVYGGNGGSMGSNGIAGNGYGGNTIVIGGGGTGGAGSSYGGNGGNGGIAVLSWTSTWGSCAISSI